MELTEKDWCQEKRFVLGSVSLRVWPAAKGAEVQSQWSALDLWIAMRTTTGVSGDEKQKQRTFHLIKRFFTGSFKKHR